MRLHKSNYFKHSVLFLSTAFLLMDTPGITAARDDTTMVRGEKSIQEYFSTYDAESTVTINHKPLSDMLASTVFPMGRSKNRLGTKGKKEKYIKSNLVHGNSKPSRFESNRLMLHAFTEEHRNFYFGYQEGLERLSLRRPLETLNRSEQLAFWLNLYNVIVINKVIKEYPLSKLNNLRKGDDSFWLQKTTTVEGIPLSLRDIETILFQNYDSPLVIYGLFQGSIGGPSLPREAFTGKNVWSLLEENAIEFVNSNRGVRPKGSKLEVSLMYQWEKAAFGNSDQEVLSHIRKYADENFLGDISGIKTVQYKYYDWLIADLIEGTFFSGEHINPAAVLGARITGSSANETLQLFLDEVLKNPFLLRNFPASGTDLLKGVFINNELPYRIPLITTKECEPGDPCEADPEHNPDSNVESKDDQLFSRPGP